MTKSEELSPGNVNKKAEDYLQYFSQADQSILKKRAEHYAEIANHYYDLATQFYEYGWGTSFHFAYPYKGEQYATALKRLEYYLAYRIGIQPGQLILDIGCGVGGPMREIARFSGAHIIGLNNNSYQIKKGEKYTQDVGLSALCSFIKADCAESLPFADNTFDGIYSLEAMCYAPDPSKMHAEILRVLKPGAYLAGTDWCVTPTYDPNNPLHFKLKEGIAKGNGIADLFTTTSVARSLQQVGFSVIESRDLANEINAGSTWYHPLEAKWSVKGFRRTMAGRIFTTQTIRILELLHLVPKGTTLVAQFLNTGADSLVEAGRLRIFTPGYFFLARKPQ